MPNNLYQQLNGYTQFNGYTQQNSNLQQMINNFGGLQHSYKSILTSEAMEDSRYSYNNGYSETYKRDNIERLSNMEYPSNYYERGYSNMRYSDNYSGRRYSRDEGKTHMIHQFEKLMDTTSNPEEREILQSAINRLNNM